MALTQFKNESDITTEWLSYIENEATSLSKQEDFEIDNYSDRELLNPDMQAFLHEVPDDEYPGITEISEHRALSLSFKERMLPATTKFGNSLQRLKNKIRKFLCQVLADLQSDSALNWQAIIKAVLILLIPSLGGGVWAVIVLPVLISLVAKVIKRGFEAVC